MKFEMMAPVLTTRTAMQTRLERGFSIIFAESYPEENEDYMAYLNRLRENKEVSTGLFFYAPRQNPAQKVIGVPFFNLISGAINPPPAGHHGDSILDMTGDAGRFYLSGAATNPDIYGFGGNRNYFEFPLNEWLNLTFKYGPVNMFQHLNFEGAIKTFTTGSFTGGSYLGTYAGITSSNYSVTPDTATTDAVIKVVVTGSPYAAAVTIDGEAGEDYSVSDVFRISGGAVGGANGVDDILATVSAVENPHITDTYRPKDYLMAYSKDITEDGAMQAVKLNLGDSHFGIDSSGTQMELNSMSLWMNNCRANDTNYAIGATSVFKNTQADAEGFTDGDNAICS